MKDNFRVIINLKKTYSYLDKIVINFPSSEKVLKDKIRSSMLEAIEICYLANEVDNRYLYQKRVIVKLKMVDFYMRLSLDKKYINYKRYIKVSSFLLNILKCIYGWVKYEKI